MSSVTVVDRGWKAIEKAIEEMKSRDAYAKVGLLGEKAAKVEEEHQGDGGESLTNVKLAVIHEFGAPDQGIPERSFIRSTFEAKRAENVAQLRQLTKAIYEGKITVRKSLGILGFKLEWDIRNAILTGPGIPPPNAPATIRAKLHRGKWNTAAKEGPRTLVDSGRLVAAISHAVVIGGETSEPAGERSKPPEDAK